MTSSSSNAVIAASPPRFHLSLRHRTDDQAFQRHAELKWESLLREAEIDAPPSS
jgi:hypothetical protein